MVCFMGCFDCVEGGFKRRKRRRASSTPNTSPAASPAICSSASNSQASKSGGESTATKAISKSSGSAGSQQSNLPALFEEKASDLRVFELKELRNATKNFSLQLRLGEGGFGTVFKGFIKLPTDGKGEAVAVAVKRLNQHGLQGHKQWLTEVKCLGVLEHKNLVKLIGYCSEDGERGIQRLLVYEFMPNRSLEVHLFNRANQCLPWNRRLEIALGAAEGLAYLHEGFGVELIYRDFKASNILLDEDFNPKLSDFGLAREGPIEGNTHVSTSVMGTFGYAAPEYVETGRLTSKCDVWSFGVVLLELLSGRRAMERNRPRNEQKLFDWLKSCGGSLRAIMDPRLEGQYPAKGAREIAKLANACIAKNARDRPVMNQVVGVLKQALEFTEVGDESLKEEIFFDALDANKGDHSGPVESFTRRMLHLANLRPGANATRMRKLAFMKAANPT